MTPTADPGQITIRPTTLADTPAVDALLAASYPVLLKPDYRPSVLVTALPLINTRSPRSSQSRSPTRAEICLQCRRAVPRRLDQ